MNKLLFATHDYSFMTNWRVHEYIICAKNTHKNKEVKFKNFSSLNGYGCSTLKTSDTSNQYSK